MTAMAVADLQASLAQAPDTQIARVVAMVDAMPQRGEADTLIAPLRARLAQLRPIRPQSFTRMLFTPLNPVIVSIAEWQRSGVGVPRASLAMLGTVIQATLPHEVGALTPEVGPAVWPAAATILDGADMPAEWPNITGLAVADYPVIAGVAATVLHEAVAIEKLVAGHQATDEIAAHAMLARSKARGAASLDTVIAVLLARSPAPARIVALAAQAAGGDRAAGQAIDRLAASLHGEGNGISDLPTAALEAARIAAMLAALENGASPQRRSQLEAIRRDADSLCRRSFSQAMTQTLAMASVAMTASSDDEAVAGMEACARDLRRLESAGRRLGGAEHYECLLSSAAKSICNAPGSLGLADQVRLVEILAGPEEALALLTAAKATILNGQAG